MYYAILSDEPSAPFIMVCVYDKPKETAHCKKQLTICLTYLFF